MSCSRSRSAAPVLAQSPGAADAYARAAGLFIDGEAEQAEAIAEQALQQSPDDAKLQALLDLIRQQQESQDNEGDGEQDEEGESDNSESGDSESGEDSQDGEGEQDGQGQQDRPEDDSQQAEQDQTRAEGQDGEGDDAPDRGEGARPGEGGETPQQPQGGQPQQMSAEQAGQILDAVGGEERLLLREMRRRPTRMRRSDKDW